MRLCRTDGCPNQAAHDRRLCHSCRWKARQTKAAEFKVTRMSERRAPDGTLLGTNTSYVPTSISTSEPIRPAAPVKVTLKIKSPDFVAKRGSTVALILPDPQIGYRRTRKGEQAFHDEAALGVSVQLAADIQPDVIVHLGDFLDLAPLSRFAQEPGFMGMTQRAIDRGHRFLAELRAVAPDHEAFLLEGNHDVRLARTLAKVAPEAAMLVPAGDDTGWPALSVPRLLSLDRVGVTYLDGYPAGRLSLPGFDCIHGAKVNSAGSTAATIVKQRMRPVLFGHVHRQELHHRTLEDGRVIWAASPGTLARIDGAVPSFHSGTSVRTGAALPVSEDWQQGVAVVSWLPDSDPVLELVRIDRGRAVYRGAAYQFEEAA